MMIRLLALELRNLTRSPRGRITFLTLASLSLAAALLGRTIVDRHRELGDRDQRASQDKISRAAAATSTITTFDLAAWSDTFIARGATPASSLTAGDLQSLPDSAAIRIFDPPVMVPSLAERSPAAILLGTFDLAWLLALLAPLAAIALGFDAVARDRERGTLAMLLAPARSRTALLFARAAAITSVLFAGLAPAAVLALEPVVLALLAAYAAALGAMVIAASALAQRVGTALAISVAGWLVWCVGVPLGAAALIRSELPLPDPRARMDGEQAAADVFQKPSAAALDREAEKDPDLDPSRGTDGISTQNRYYLLLARERLRIARGARHQEDRVLRQRIELAEIAQWFSPATIVAASLAELASTTPRERINFAADAEQHRARVEELVHTRVIANENRFAAAEEWPRFRRPDRSRRDTTTAAALLFAALAAAIFAATAARFERMDLAPTREDA